MESAILIFAKVPIAGIAKTRLSENTCLSISDCAKIAEAMLKDTICLSSQTIASRIEIGFFPSNDLNHLKNIVKQVKIEGNLNKPIDYLLQSGSNFDERFGSVVKKSFENGLQLIAGIGADLPFLDPKIINQALATLAKRFEENLIVLGPSSGGGIYLVGITNKFNPSWFSDYKLFRGGVELSRFTSFCRKKDFPVITLPPYGDIDIEEDLVTLISYIKALGNSEKTFGFFFPHFTAKLIEELGLFIIEEEDKTRRRKIAKRSES